MSNELLAGEQQTVEFSVSMVMAAPQPEQTQEDAVMAASQEKLDEIENIDFLLEEIENKIAPLALA